MDPKTPAKSRRTSADAPAEKVEAPARSSHVIDLRQQKAQSASAPAAPATAAKKPAPARKPAKPVVKKESPEPTITPEDFFDGDVLSSPDNKRRFWPAFGRFLALLVILGLVIAGGLYLYITYLQS